MQWAFLLTLPYTCPAAGPGRATLYVKTLTGGKSVKVQLTLDSTVDDLKQAVTEKEGER